MVSKGKRKQAQANILSKLEDVGGFLTELQVENDRATAILGGAL